MPPEEQKIKRGIIAAVQQPNVSEHEFESSLMELRELAKTLGFEVVHTFIQKRAGFDRTGYLGIGKRQEIQAFVNNTIPLGDPDADADVDENDEAMTSAEIVEGGGEIDVLFIDHEISPTQARTLEVEIGCEVMDRTMVILEIFDRNARSRAAKAQVEIARLGYMAPHLREAAKLAGPQGRQRSGMGGRGAGESHTELDRRKVRDRIAELQKEIVA
ncbi:MAG TPA: GTPase HflX, partial [Rhodocyclaceae bacterium]|nr:GTPase HflX [Rhodocyclaceae bacterium]